MWQFFRARLTSEDGRWRAAAMAAVLVLLGFGLRAAYYHEGYSHPDETITVEVVRHMRLTGDWDTNWSKADLEPALRYDQYNFSSDLYATYFFYRVVKLLPGTAGWRDRDEGFWVYRFFSVLLGTLAVWQTWLLARRAAGNEVALVATALMATATLLVQDAHFVRPESFVTVLTLLAVTCCWPGRHVHFLRVAIGAVAIGLLIACKVSMVLIAWLPLVPIAMAWSPTRSRWLPLLVAPLAIGAGFAVGAPGALRHPALFLNGVQHLTAQYAGAHPPHSHFSGAMVGDMFFHYFGATLGWPLLLAVLFGSVVLAGRRRWDALALLAGPVALFIGVFATRTVFFERNVSHVLPLLLVLAAVGGVEVARWLAVRTDRAGWLWLLAVTMVLITRSVFVTGTLVREEFSGRSFRERDDFENALRARYPGSEWRPIVLLIGAPLNELAERMQATAQPVLLRVTDYHDDWTPPHLLQFENRFRAELVAEFPGTFPDQPMSTLLTYHSARDRYYLVTGKR